MPSSSSPTLSDVAKLAGVSTATVSRCLNDPDRVVPETRARVMRAVEELSYTPHFGGQVLASRKSNTVGAVIPTMENAIFARGLQAFEEELALDGYTLLVASTNYDPAREYEQVKKLVARGADGLLLIGWERPKKLFDFLKSRDFPTVVAWNMRAEDDALCSGFDNREAARKLAEKVLGYGHRSIAMIAGVTAGNDRATDRLAGVRDAMSKLPLDSHKLRVVEAPYTIDCGARAFQKLITEEPQPTAVICGNDVLAVGALSEAKRIGMNVPRDVSITGYDDIDLSTVTDPPLTTVHVPHRRMGQAAARLLLDRMSGTVEGYRVAFETEIVERGSLGPAPKMRLK
jgi:LacI family transcriptional regulator